MDGLPVVIRLIDPPLHEFLPSPDELIEKVTRLRTQREDGKSIDAAELDEATELLQAVEAMREQNPMLGLRGCRLGLLIPDIVQMQTRAILDAAARVNGGGQDGAAGDHDPAGRTRERAEGDARDPRRRGAAHRRRQPASRSPTSSAP